MHTKVITIAVLLVYVGFTTAVPSPVAEDSPAAQLNKDGEAETALDSASDEPSKRNTNPNPYDLPHHIQCTTGYGLYRVRTGHSNSKEDRYFEFFCRYVTSSPYCYWTGYINAFDEPISFMCPVNYYMGGISSYHDNGKEDRRFNVQCCRGSGVKTHECFITGYVNWWDSFVDYSVPHGYVMVGTASVHDNGREDRRYKFINCKVY